MEPIAGFLEEGFWGVVTVQPHVALLLPSIIFAKPNHSSQDFDGSSCAVIAWVQEGRNFKLTPTADHCCFHVSVAGQLAK